MYSVLVTAQRRVHNATETGYTLSMYQAVHCQYCYELLRKDDRSVAAAALKGKPCQLVSRSVHN